MRKMTLLFSLVCAFFISATAMAQTFVAELQDKVVKSVSATPISSLDELTEGEWYFMVNEHGGTSYAYDNGYNLYRGLNGSTIAVNDLVANCGNGLFRITDRKTATIGTFNSVGFHMQWGTGNYTVWPGNSTDPVVHNQPMTTTTETDKVENENKGWVYAVPLTYNNATWFQLVRNTNTLFSNGVADLNRGRNIMISGRNGCDRNVVDYSLNTSTLVSSSQTASDYFWKIYKVELVDLAKITVQIKNNNEPVQKEFTISAAPGTTITLRDHLRKYSFVTFEDKQIEVVAGTQTVQLGYSVDEAAEAAFPFATTYAELSDQNKWLSMFTKNGRMHVHDANSTGAGVRKYPTIDRATFTGLDEHYFWGFVRADRFSPVYVYNKAVGSDRTLYLTSDGNDVPVLFPNETDNVDDWVTNDWVVEKGLVADGIQYFGLRAMGTRRYINNNGNKGFMTTWQDGPLADAGSNMKFTPELETYTTLKDRALNAPFNAVYSLNKAARDEIRNSSANTVAAYKTLIDDINSTSNTTGFVDWEEKKYYFFRNYTPAGEKTYLLGTVNGTNGAGIEITGEDELGNTTDTPMTCSDANTIWQIVTKEGATAGGGNSTGIGVSRTIARHIKHINSEKYFTGVNNRQLSDNKTDYYFVNLGDGQLFLKNVQYTGTGEQAKAHSLNCNNYGVLGESGNAHFKNTRDTWYAIEATTLKIKLNDGGDGKYYATAHFPFAISITENAGMKAYTVGSINSEGGHMNLEEATGKIPANTGLILIGNQATSTVNIIAGSNKMAEADPILKGVNMAETFGTTIAKDDVLVLGKDANGNVGFYKPGTAMDGLRSNSAYILVSDVPNGTEANGLKFNFGGIANGIDGVNADSNNGQVIYDLQGRRVNKLSKGLYIVNGKKVIR
ncbi:MAG: hypothetical protein IJY00_04650 [Bacteroidaceae bacterium]|nr:hypothetical protein [Bacteroidaceae bacterium]